jgi:hypothetical protein
MAYEGGKRLKIINLVKEALEAKLYFKRVFLQMPTSPPSGIDLPAAYVTLAPATLEGITNKEKQEEMQLAVILFVRADKNVDRVKVEGIDRTEEAIQDLQTNADFEEIASMIDVYSYDPGPLALAQYGLENFDVLPPLGVVRLDVRVTFIYQGFN